jgi:hypothetical protein
VLYCTLLARAPTGAERTAVEDTMRADPALNELLGRITGGDSGSKAGDAQAARRAAKRAEKLDSDLVGLKPFSLWTCSLVCLWVD